jgi:ABC-type enterobactin transport system permease subunit
VKLGLRRLLIAGLLLASATAWAAYWAERFFASRKAAETAMDQLQKLMGRGYFSPALDQRVTQALEQSHVALALAFGGPLGLAIACFSLRFFLMTRKDG